MMTHIRRIIAVLNDFDMAQAVLKKAFMLSEKQNASVEVLYVHETSLLSLPNYFLSEDMIVNNTLDKAQVKKEIRKRIQSLGYEKECALFTYIDDTAHRVMHLAKDDSQTLIVTAYHESVTKHLLAEVSQSILLVRGEQDRYEDIAISLNSKSHSLSCITAVAKMFEGSNLHLLYDYRYVVDPSMQLDLQNLSLIERNQREAFEVLKHESKLDGKFFVDGSFLGDEYIDYIQAQDPELILVCSREDDFFVSDSLALNLLKHEAIKGDIFVVTTPERS